MFLRFKMRFLVISVMLAACAGLQFVNVISGVATAHAAILSNPGFETGTSPWVFYTNGVGTFANDAAGDGSARAAHIKITTAGTNVQMQQTGLALEANTLYRLSFKAYSSTGHDVSVLLLKHVSPNTNYGLSGRVFNLTNAWQFFMVEFTTKNFTGTVSDGRLMFWLAPYDASGDHYYFDDVVLEKVVATAVPPAITTHPVSQTVVVGQAATYNVAATGTAPLGYQWQKNGVNISGATGVSYTTPATAIADSGTSYRCVVSNSAGSVTSNAATLTVTNSAAVSVVLNGGFETGTSPWVFYTNGAGTFANDAAGDGSAKSGHIKITTAGTNVQLQQSGLALEANTLYRLSFRAYSNTGHDLSVSLQRHTSPYTNYGLSGRVFNLTSAWQLFTVEFTTTGFTGTASDGRLMYWLAPYDAGGDHYYFDDVVLEKVVAVVPPVVTTQPANQTVAEGQTVVFTVAATGTAPLGYQWQKNGVNISGATGAAYTTPQTAIADSGATYRCIVSNTAGSVTSSAATLTVNAIPPAITTQPAGQTVTEGETATFTVAASGTAPLSYQWQKNGVNISGATGLSYTTPPTAFPDSRANYRCVISNTAGSITSSAATLTVNAIPPAVATQPANQTVVVGQTATFNVAATGTVPLNYQWQKNGIDIPGANGTSYTTPPATLSDSGSGFRCVVTNPGGSVSSNEVILTVTIILSDDFSSGSLNAGLWNFVNPLGDASFSLTGAGTEDAFLSITVPSGVSHDVWSSNMAPRLMQAVSNSDFEAEVKFQSQMTSQYQFQGIIVEQDSNDFIRFDFVRDETRTRVFAASTTNGTPGIRLDVPIYFSNPLYLRVKRVGNQWTQSYSYNGRDWQTAGTFSHALTVTAVGPFAGNVGNPAPGFTCNIDYFFDTTAPILSEDGGDTTPPVVNIWYGPQQPFGQIGIPQAWVNILGNVSDHSGVAGLTYSLNGGVQMPLSTGPDGIRLQSFGDFNADISYADILCGANSLDITATDVFGNAATNRVDVEYTCGNFWPRTYSIDWSTVTSIQDAAQVVDGLWILEGNTIRPEIAGYDRLIAIGDIDPSWKDYEISVPITINAPLNASVPYGPLFGVAMHWQGHYDWDGSQPRWGWHPLGAMGIYDWVPQAGDYRLRILGNAEGVIAEDLSGRHLLVGVPYIFRMRAESVGDRSIYSLKVWEAGTTEPSVWSITGDGLVGGLKHGSLMLITHYADVSFGNVTINPGPFIDDNTPPVISNIAITPDTHSASISWTTDEISSSIITYGSTAAYENGTVQDITMVTSHMVILTGLASESMYHFQITSSDINGNSSASSDLTLTTTAESGPPVITTQPANKIAEVGQTATFSVVVTGAAPLSYQWFMDGVPIPDAGAASYTTPATTQAYDGAFLTCFISNSAGNVTSNPARLTVTGGQDGPLNDAPGIVSGAPRFLKQVIDTTMDQTHFAATGDFDRDGDTDVVATDYVDDTVVWYENNGVGGFTKHIIDANLDGAYPVFVADLNLDGAVDVLSTGYLADMVVWYENNGSGGFSRRIIDASADGVHSLYTTDLDGDGDTDLVGALQDGNAITWYENNGSTVFIEHPPIDLTAPGAKSVFAADLDGDNDIDIAAASFDDDTVAWYENDGSQYFIKRSIDTAADGAYSVLGADLDSDSDTDLLAASKNDDTIAWYENNGLGGFTWRAIDIYADAARAVFASDVDGDGDIDVLSASVDDDTIAWYKNNGSGGFSMQLIDGAADGAYGVFASNVDGDGQMDVVTASRDDNTIAVYYQIKAHYASLAQGGILTIGTNLLEASDVDNVPAELTFTVSDLPDFGELQLNGVPLAPGGSFTQDDIDNNRIVYIHSGANTINDAFVFTLIDGGQDGVRPGSGTFTLNIVDPLAPVITSDDFSAGSLAPYWYFEGPAGTGSSLATAGNEAFLQLTVPSGNYDLWDTNLGARLMQDAPNEDFTVEVKFLSQPVTTIEVKGILIEQDAGNWIRFDTVHDGTNQRVFSAVTVNGASTMKLDKVIAPDSALYLRVTRTGDNWTMEYSADGATWMTAGGFTHTLNVTKVGPFAGSTAGSPGFTVQVDYFFNTFAPIANEDGI